MGLLLDPDIHNIIFNSNQVVHSRGRALAYLRNNEKKRKVPLEFDVEGEDGEGEQRRARHEYKRKHDPSAQNPLLLQMQLQRSGATTPFSAFSYSAQHSRPSNNAQHAGAPFRKPNVEQQMLIQQMADGAGASELPQ
jgi:hypothetical protein